MSIGKRCPSLRGDLPKAFWLAAIVWTIGYIVVFLVLVHVFTGGRWTDVAYLETEQGIRDAGLAMLVPYLIGLYPSLAMSIQRLHDLNLSGWWCLPLYAPSAFYLLAPVLGFSSSPQAPTPFDQILTWTSTGVGILYIIVLGFIRGTRGPNAYGDDPVTKSPALA